MSVMLLMAIDPGPHIGLAYKLPDGRYFTATLTEPEELWALMHSYHPDHVAFETFATGGRVDVNMLHTIELVGSIRATCFILDIPSHGQQPQARKSFLWDAAKILTKQHPRGTTPHETDALAHLLCLEYRLSQGDLQTRGELAPTAANTIRALPTHATDGARTV